MPKKPPEGTEGLGSLSPLSPEASRALNYFTEKVRDSLLEDARRRSAGKKDVDESDVEHAYFELVDPNRMRVIQQVISTALSENRIFEFATYAMILGLFILGSFLLYTGLTQPNDMVARVTGVVGGSMAQILVLPALKYAINVRRHNISIRMVGALIARTEDPKLLASTLKDVLKGLLDGRA